MSEIAAASALVLLAKNLVDTVKGFGELIRNARRDRGEQEQFDVLIQRFHDYNVRLQSLAIQLEQSERLTRMVPAWLEIANQMPFWNTPDVLSAAEMQKVDHELRQLIFESIQDHFSATFFRTDYGALPGVDDTIKEFRTLLKEFDRTLSAIPPGQRDVFVGLWGSLATQFNGLTNKAWELRRLAEDLQGGLVREVREAADAALTLKDTS